MLLVALCVTTGCGGSSVLFLKLEFLHYFLVFSSAVWDLDKRKKNVFNCFLVVVVTTSKSFVYRGSLLQKPGGPVLPGKPLGLFLNLFLCSLILNVGLASLGTRWGFRCHETCPMALFCAADVLSAFAHPANCVALCSH